MPCSLLRTLSLVMAGFFTYAAIVQWNDPDWFTWMFLYAAAACFSLQYGVSTLSVYPSTIFGVVALLRLAMIFFFEIETIDSIFDMFETELGRELGGCLVVTFWMAIMAATSLTSQIEPNLWSSIALVVPVFSIVMVSLGLPLWLKWRNVSVEDHCRGTLPTLTDLFPASKTEL